jgi:soluble lytic murein transglycosylase-like protein
LKRFLAILLVGAVFLSINATPAQAGQSWRWNKCRFQYYDGKKNWSPTEVKLTIKCAEAKFPSSLTTAMAVADRESNFYQFADNPYSSASGVYQFIDSTWSSLRYNHLDDFARRWDLHTSVWDARANVMVAVRWAQISGWCPTWSSTC